MGRNWFVRRGGKQKGPFSSDDLKKYADSGRLRPDDDVRRDGQRDWVKASAVKGLFVAGPHDPSLGAVGSATSTTVEQQGVPSGSGPRHMRGAGDDNHRRADADNPGTPGGISELIRRSARLVVIALTATVVLFSGVVALVYLGGVGAADGKSSARRKQGPSSVVVEERTPAVSLDFVEEVTSAEKVGPVDAINASKDDSQWPAVIRLVNDGGHSSLEQANVLLDNFIADGGSPHREEAIRLKKWIKQASSKEAALLALRKDLPEDLATKPFMIPALKIVLTKHIGNGDFDSDVPPVLKGTWRNTLLAAVEEAAAPPPLPQEVPPIAVAGIALGMKEEELIHAFGNVDFARVDMALCPRYSTVMTKDLRGQPTPFTGPSDAIKDWSEADFERQRSGYNKLVKSLPAWMGEISDRYVSRSDWHDYWHGPNPPWQFIAFNGGPLNTSGIRFTEVKYHRKYGVLAVEFVYKKDVDPDLVRTALEAKFGPGDRDMTVTRGIVTERIGKNAYASREGTVSTRVGDVVWRPARGVEVLLADQWGARNVRLKYSELLDKIDSEVRNARYEMERTKEVKKSEQFGL